MVWNKEGAAIRLCYKLCSQDIAHKARIGRKKMVQPTLVAITCEWADNRSWENETCIRMLILRTQLSTGLPCRSWSNPLCKLFGQILKDCHDAQPLSKEVLTRIHPDVPTYTTTKHKQVYLQSFPQNCWQQKYNPSMTCKTASRRSLGEP